MAPSALMPAINLALSSAEPGFFSQKKTWCKSLRSDSFPAGAGGLVSVAISSPETTAAPTRVEAARNCRRLLESILLFLVTNETKQQPYPSPIKDQLPLPKITLGYQ